MGGPPHHVAQGAAAATLHRRQGRVPRHKGGRWGPRGRMAHHHALMARSFSGRPGEGAHTF